MTDLHHFRTAYVAHNSRHDFRELTKLANNIVFVSTGYEPEDTLASSMEEVMKDFDPRQDITVPVGNVTSNLLLGVIAARHIFYLNQDVKFQDQSITAFFMAIYKDGQYHVREVHLGGSNE